MNEGTGGQSQGWSCSEQSWCSGTGLPSPPKQQTHPQGAVGFVAAGWRASGSQHGSAGCSGAVERGFTERCSISSCHVLTGSWQPTLFVITFFLSSGKSTSHPVATCKPGLNVPEGEDRIVWETDTRISSPLPFIRLCQLPRSAPNYQFVFLDRILKITLEEGKPFP